MSILWTIALILRLLFAYSAIIAYKPHSHAQANQGPVGGRMSFCSVLNYY